MARMGTPVYVTLRSPSEHDEPAFRDPGVIDVTHPAGQARLVVDLALWPELALVAGDASGGADTPADHLLRTTLAELVFADVLQWLAQAQLHDVRLSVKRRAALHATRHARVDVCVNAARVPCEIERMDEGLLDTIFACVPRLPVGRNLALRVPGVVELGQITLGLAAVLRLRAGDVIIGAVNMSGAQGAAGRRATAHWGARTGRHVRAEIALEEQRFCILEVAMDDGSEDDGIWTDGLDGEDAGLPPMDVEPLLAVDEMEVLLRAQVATVSMSVKELVALGPGQVIELPVPLLDAQVRLVAGNQLIATGELVAVGEHLGIRIVRIQNSHGTTS